MGLSRVGGGTAWTPTLSSSPLNSWLQDMLSGVLDLLRPGSTDCWHHAITISNKIHGGCWKMLAIFGEPGQGLWTWEPCQLKSKLFKHAMLMRSLSKSGFALRLRLDPSKVGYFALWGGQHLSLPQTVSDAPGKGPERWLAIDVWTPLTYYKIYEGRASDRWPDPSVSGPSSGMQRHAK